MKRRFANGTYPTGMMKGVLLVFLWAFFIMALPAQIPIETLKISSPLKIDGLLNEEVWAQAKGYSDFISFAPDYGKAPKEKTLVYLAYDADNLYFAFKCFDKEPGKIIANVKKRDDLSGEDKVAIFIDSHNDGQNAYLFSINLLGIQQDGILDSDNSNDYSPDFIWESVGVKDSEGYTLEVRIPFKTLRFSNAKVVKMRIGFLRLITRYSEQYAFPEWKPGGAIVTNLGYCQFEGINCERVIEILPAATYMSRRERNPNDKMETSTQKSLGLTAKIGITSDLTLDFTYNPDFSHIEIDEGQVDVNLRVDPLYEEKRPFFLEGLEHFKFAGCGPDEPIEKIVHTRKIIEPEWGLKLSGKIGRSNIVNSLFTVDESPKYLDRSVPGEHGYYGIFRYKHLFKGDSYIGGIYTGKIIKDWYQHVGGIDAKLRLNRYITTEAFYIHSFDNTASAAGLRDDGWALGGRMKFENREYLLSLGYHDISTNFFLEAGRIKRNGIGVISANGERYFYLSSDFLKLITLGYSGSISRDKKFELNEYAHNLYLGFQFPAQTTLNIGYNFSTEVYEGSLFDTNHFFMDTSIRFSKFLRFSLAYSAGNYPFYDPALPSQGFLKMLVISVNFNLSKQFATSFTFKRDIFHEDSAANERGYKYSIYWNKTTFQLNKYLSLRGIIEYNHYYKTIFVDSLLGFTYIPGTVIYLGYGSTLEKGFEGSGVSRYDQFKETRSSLFFKASYLFRF